MILTIAERAILAQQHVILRYLEPEEATFHEAAAEALFAGYDLAIIGLLGRVETGLRENECSAVIRSMAMYLTLQHSAANLESEDFAAGELEFPGFDNHTEPTLVSYAVYLRQHQRMFHSLRTGPHDLEGAVMPAMPGYMAMLAVFDSTEKAEGLLSASQLRAVLAARDAA
jgi:uncharacterized protein YfbU (UPF0304 family)